jgi:cell division protein FtsB
MGKFSYFFSRIKPYFRNKYVLLFLFLGIYFALFDSFSWRSKRSNDKRIKELKNDIAYYENAIESTKRQREELQSSNKNLEKFAREEYLMKKPNEDIFIVDEE